MSVYECVCMRTCVSVFVFVCVCIYMYPWTQVCGRRRKGMHMKHSIPCN